MRVIVKTPDFQDTTLRPFTPPANESKRAKSSWMGIARKPLLVETSTPGVYDRFDFSSAPFSCVNDFLEGTLSMDRAYNPKHLTIRYYDEGSPYDLPVKMSFFGDHETSGETYLPGVYNLTCKVFDELVINHDVSTRCPFLICKKLIIAPGKSLCFSAPPGSGVVPYTYPTLKLSTHAIITSSAQGLGGGSAPESAGPLIFQGLPGTDGLSLGDVLGSGGGGSGGIWANRADQWGNLLSPNAGGSGTIFRGGSGGKAWTVAGLCWEYPRPTTPPYFGRTSTPYSSDGGRSLFIYAEEFDSQGTVSSDGAGQGTIGLDGYGWPTFSEGLKASSGAGGGGVIVVHTKNLIRQGTIRCNGGSVTSATLNAYGGGGGNGSYKVVTL